MAARRAAGRTFIHKVEWVEDLTEDDVADIAYIIAQMIVEKMQIQMSGDEKQEKSPDKDEKHAA